MSRSDGKLLSTECCSPTQVLSSVTSTYYQMHDFGQTISFLQRKWFLTRLSFLLPPRENHNDCCIGMLGWFKMTLIQGLAYRKHSMNIFFLTKFRTQGILYAHCYPDNAQPAPRPPRDRRKERQSGPVPRSQWFVLSFALIHAAKQLCDPEKIA